MHPIDERFRGIVRLLGLAAFQRLRHAHVGVIGLGGVGSWAVEALARTGIGRLTLIDFDVVALTNFNRQVQAVTGELGQPKGEALARRVRQINPACEVNPCRLTFGEATLEWIWRLGFDHVVEAIDQVTPKCVLLASARGRKIQVTATGGAGGRRDPTQIRVTDLAFTTHDPLLEQVRGQLRREHAFPRGRTPFGIECVYSLESRAAAQAMDSTPETAGAVPDERPGGFGTAGFVTGAFGFALASRVVRQLARVPPDPESGLTTRAGWTPAR